MSQFPDFQFVRSNTVHRCNDAMENVIGTPESPSLFDGNLVAGFLHHADQPGITVGVAADNAGIGFGKGETLVAEVDGFVQHHQVGSQVFGLGSGSSQHKKGQPGRCFTADAG